MSSTKIVLKVDGMSCDACVRSVTRKLRRVPGVQSAEVSLGADHAPGRAEVQVDNAQADTEQLIRAVEQIGYHAIAA
jgi:copper chaperone CopZ